MALPQDLPLRDDPSLRAVLKYDSKNDGGRQRFQAELFACGAYADLLESVTLRYDAPRWLPAVVYVESGCDPHATSQVGGAGLWQLGPLAARAYGLRVVDGEVDDRLDPVSSSEAAVHLLTDLERRFGAWDLALAAYRSGPLAILVCLKQIGTDAGFGELSQAEFLNDETRAYVFAVEARALVLENLTRFGFTRPKVSPEPAIEAGTATRR